MPKWGEREGGPWGFENKMLSSLHLHWAFLPLSFPLGLETFLVHEKSFGATTPPPALGFN